MVRWWLYISGECKVRASLVYFENRVAHPSSKYITGNDASWKVYDTLGNTLEGSNSYENEILFYYKRTIRQEGLKVKKVGANNIWPTGQLRIILRITNNLYSLVAILSVCKYAGYSQ